MLILHLFLCLYGLYYWKTNRLEKYLRCLAHGWRSKRAKVSNSKIACFFFPSLYLAGLSAARCSGAISSQKHKFSAPDKWEKERNLPLLFMGASRKPVHSLRPSARCAANWIEFFCTLFCSPAHQHPLIDGALPFFKRSICSFLDEKFPGPTTLVVNLDLNCAQLRQGREWPKLIHENYKTISFKSLNASFRRL